MFAPSRLHLLSYVLLLSLPFSATLQAAANPWRFCSKPVFKAHKSPKLAEDVSLLLADQLESIDANQVLLQGQVEAFHNEYQINAEELIYNKQTEQLQARGNARFSSPSNRVIGQQLAFDNRSEQADIEDVDFYLLERHGSGSGSRLVQQDADHYTLYDVAYSTCDDDNRFWQLKASEMNVDDTKGLGEAWNTRLYLGSVPVFYFPWVQFPIDNRRLSGLLVPTFSLTDNLGTGISLPWYLNLNPQFDATVTTTNYTRRGLHLGSELRYLSENSTGQFDFGHIDDEVLLQQRQYGRWLHETRFGDSTRLFWNLQEASDVDYLDDYGDVSPVGDQKYLESYWRLHHYTPHWAHEFQFQHFQVLDTSIVQTDRPYQRLPHYLTRAKYPLADSDWSLQFLSDAGYFEHESLASGRRLHLEPRLQYQNSGDYYFLNSGLSYQRTRYRMNDPFDNKDSQFLDLRIADREVSTFSIDGGLIFERLYDAQDNILQTLEPRVMLVNTPYVDQVGLPKFDTKELGISFDNLFVENRFSGYDRIGDERRLSLGLTTRFIDADKGHDLLSASLGQAHFGDERKVGLDKELIDAPSRSFQIGTFKISPSRSFSWRYTIAQDKDIDKAMIRQSNIDLKSSKGHQLKLGYNQKFNVNTLVNDLDQKSLSFVWPLQNRWNVFGKRIYSSRVHRIKLNDFGISYEDCCWGFQALVRTEAATDASDKTLDYSEKDHGIYFQLVLKGLAGVGRDIGSVVAKDGVGYRSPFSN